MSLKELIDKLWTSDMTPTIETALHVLKALVAVLAVYTIATYIYLWYLRRKK
jgi:hypothetical protein